MHDSLSTHTHIGVVWLLILCVRMCFCILNGKFTLYFISAATTERINMSECESKVMHICRRAESFFLFIVSWFGIWTNGVMGGVVKLLHTMQMCT